MKELIFKNWWIITIKGIITVLFGIIAILLPDKAVIYAVSAFGTIALISGFMMVGFTFLRKHDKDKFCRFFEGGIDILLGIFIVSNPQNSALFLLTVMMIWISLMGLLQIYNGYRMRSLLNNLWVLILNGFLAILFAVLIFTQSFNGSITLAILIGLQAVVFGSFLIISSIKLKQILDEIKIEIPAKEGEEGNQELSFY